MKPGAGKPAPPPIFLTCTTCNGEGESCPACGGRGRVMLTQCPLDYVTPDVWELFDFANFADKGVMPVSGGSLDQTQIFLDAYAFRCGEKTRWIKQAIEY